MPFPPGSEQDNIVDAATFHFRKFLVREISENTTQDSENR